MATAALVLTVAAGTPALAHPEVRETRPSSGDVLPEPPAEVRAVLSERVDPVSRATVTDGCGQELVSTTTVSDEVVRVQVADGAPGAWRVALDLVSAEDGHPVRSSYGFTVQGAASCGVAPSLPAEKASPAPAPAALPEESSGSTTTLVLLSLAAATVVGGAVVVRRRTGG